MSAEAQTTPCPVCPHHCAPAEGKLGHCRARVARGGQVLPVGYGRLAALALDPTRKKPLYHFHPGSKILSVGGFGCNLRCPFCQNYEISQSGQTPGLVEVSPESLCHKAEALRPQGNIGLAFTYNEPAVGFEFVRDTARLAKQRGLATAMVTNGCYTPAVAEALLACVDAFNIDLKCFSEEGYKQLGGGLETVKENIRQTAARAHLEVTTLVVPGLSDDDAEMDAEAAFLAAISPNIPLHLSRYFPRWQAQAPPTPIATLQRLQGIAKAHLRHVYLGNC